MRKLLSKIILSILISATLLVSPVFAQTLSNWDLLNLFEQVKQTEPDIIKPYQIINLPQAWQQLELQKPISHPITIGIADTGVDSSHQEFNGVDLISDSPDIAAAFRGGHGTQVAGIIGANNNSFSGKYFFPQMNGIISGFRDLNSKIFARRVLNLVWIERFISGVDSVSSISALENLAAVNPNIVNMSVGGNYNNLQTFNNYKQIYEKFFNTYSKILFVTATNDDGLDTSKTLPAAIKLPNTITVAATDLNDQRASFSGFGSLVDLAAPGVGVYAPAPGNKYDKNFTGTSASAPLVTGVAGLIKAIKPDFSPAQIKQILISNADPIQTDKPIGPRLNALKAICDPLVLNCPVPPPSQLPVWPMFQKNAQHTGLSDVAGPLFATSSAVTLKWQKSFAIPSGFSPIVGTQAIYVGAGSNLFAFDKANGNQIWQASIPAGAVNGALGPDGTIYVCGLNVNQQSVLTAVNPADGQIKWQFIVGSFRSCNDPAVAENGTIFTTIPPPLNTQTAVVVAVNPDGTQKWRHEEGNLSTTAPALSNDESQVYVGFYDTLKAFNAQNGQILWNKNTPIFSYLITVDSNDRILDNIINGPIAAFSKTGSFLWQSGSVSAMALYPGNRIFTTNPDGYKFLNASDGSLISFGSWPSGFQLLGHAFPIVDKDGLIYLPLAIFGSPSQVRLFAFDGSGTARWIFDVPSNLNFVAVGGSALNSDGTLYLLAQGLLFAF